MNISVIIWGFLAGIAAGMGLGGGTVLLIYLSLFAGVSQLTAQGINLIVFIPTALVAVIIYSIKKKICWKKVLIMAPLGIVGSLVGSYVLQFIPNEFLSKILGGVLIIMGLKRLFARRSCKEQK